MIFEVITCENSGLELSEGANKRPDPGRNNVSFLFTAVSEKPQ